MAEDLQSELESFSPSPDSGYETPKGGPSAALRHDAGREARDLHGHAYQQREQPGAGLIDFFLAEISIHRAY